MIQVVTQDQIRDLLIPSSEPNAHPTIWPRTEFDRIERKAWIKSFQDHLEEMNKFQQDKQRAKEESEKRKAMLREIDRAKTAKMSVVSKKKGLLVHCFDILFSSNPNLQTRTRPYPISSNIFMSFIFLRYFTWIYRNA